jgi:hypothetical protein
MMLRLIVSIMAGLAIAVLLIVATDTLFHTVSTTPAPDPGNADAMRDYVARQPPALLGGIVLGWSLAAFSGAAVAARAAGRRQGAGWSVTLLVLLATAANFVLVEHPVWMAATAILAIPAAGALATRLAAPRPNPTPAKAGAQVGKPE